MHVLIPLAIKKLISLSAENSDFIQAHFFKSYLFEVNDSTMWSSKRQKQKDNPHALRDTLSQPAVY